MNTSLLIGILIMLFGIGLRYWINRRKFNRRGPNLLAHFSSYEKSITIRSVEWFIKILAYAFILFGMFNNW